MRNGQRVGRYSRILGCQWRPGVSTAVEGSRRVGRIRSYGIFRREDIPSRKEF